MANVFEAGMAAEIEVNGLADKYSTKIEQVQGDYLLVATPMRAREYIKLDQGQKILLSVVRRNNPYFFDTMVVGQEVRHGRPFGFFTFAGIVFNAGMHAIWLNVHRVRRRR